VASDVYLKVEGIDGDSQVAGHEAEMELMGWSISTTLPTGPRSSGGSGAAGSSIHSDLSATKAVDEASNSLNEACWTGKTIPSAVLTVQRQGSDAGDKVDYLKITMTDVLISNISTSGGSADVPTETLSLNYASVMREYFTTQTTGGSGGWQSTGWNVATEEPL
jgi:type VI secretion system secreted protein Hcp